MENITTKEPDISVLLTNFQINMIVSCAILILVPFIYKLRRISPSVKPEPKIIYNKECPICFNFFQMPVKSHCGHAFCMDCIYSYSEISTWKASCPLCRSPLNHLHILEGEDDYSVIAKKQLLDKIHQMSSKQSLRFHIFSIPVVGYIYGILISLLWTLVIFNMDYLINSVFLIYKYLYGISNEITT